LATLAGQRAQFTWALNQYNLSEDPDTRAKYARRMAKYVAAAPANGFTASQVTTGQSYPSEVDQFVNDPSVIDELGPTEEQAVKIVKETVDTSEVRKMGDGAGIVYAYGYRCCQDRIKIGSTDLDAVERIAQQINISTPDKPVLLIEIKTNKCRAFERAIQATLETRGCKITGGGAEWFRASRDDILAIYEFINKASA
jgi:hypothetical protein